jgi:hypothetical protein
VLRGVGGRGWESIVITCFTLRKDWTLSSLAE